MYSGSMSRLPRIKEYQYYQYEGIARAELDLGGKVDVVQALKLILLHTDPRYL